MATLITDYRARTDMTMLDLYGLSVYKMSVTPTTITYADWSGNTVVFHGSGFSASPSHGIPNTGHVTGYTLTLSGIAAQTVTGLDLGPGELEGFIALANGGIIPAQERFWRGNDLLIGGDFEDYLTGQNGNDRLYGGANTDYLVGGNGHDQLYGGADGDNLYGGSGADSLYGGAADDNLTGDAGNDALIGGMGLDDLTGGVGRDRFVFLSARETSSDPARADIIRDFEHGIDRIDLSAIDAQAFQPGKQKFTFIGANAFSHHKGELRAYSVESGTQVQGDINGDGTADFAITLDKTLNMTAGDFIL